MERRAVPTGSDVVALQPQHKRRRGAVVLAVLIGAQLIGVIYLAVLMVVSGLTGDGDGAPDESSPLAQVLLGVGLSGAAVLPAVMIAGHVRIARAADPYAVLSAEGLTIHDSSVFVGPQFLAGSAIRKVFVGPGVTVTFRSFPMFSKDAPVVVSVHAEPPNALVVFHAPTLLDRAYVPVTTYRNWTGRAPSCKKPVAQVWLAFADPAAAFEAFRQRCPTEWADGALGQSAWIRT